MRSLAPRPILLALTILAVVGAIAFVEFRFNAVGQADTQARVIPPTTGEVIEGPAPTEPAEAKETPKPAPDQPAKQEKPEEAERAQQG